MMEWSTSNDRQNTTDTTDQPNRIAIPTTVQLTPQLTLLQHTHKLPTAARSGTSPRSRARSSTASTSASSARAARRRAPRTGGTRWGDAVVVPGGGAPDGRRNTRPTHQPRPTTHNHNTQPRPQPKPQPRPQTPPLVCPVQRNTGQVPRACGADAGVPVRRVGMGGWALGSKGGS